MLLAVTQFELRRVRLVTELKEGTLLCGLLDVLWGYLWGRECHAPLHSFSRSRNIIYCARKTFCGWLMQRYLL